MSARRPTAAILALLLAFALGACGSDDDTSSPDATETTVAPDDTSDPDEGDAPSDGESEDPESNPGVETLVDGPAEADKTVTFADGAWDPATLEVAPGEVFTFVAAADAGTVAVSFNGSDSYTLSGGLTESFTLETPGTYTVSEYLSGTTMTVTVAG